MISLDFETSGLDLHHSARPFAVVWCGPTGPQCREWAVDPLTRACEAPVDTVAELRALVSEADRIVFHNAQFDTKCLEHLGIDPPWDKFEDTLIASHVLFSAPPHNLTHVADVYLDEDLKPFEVGLEKAVKKCRSLVQQARLKEGRGKTDIADLSPLRRWRIAEDGDPGLPSGSGADVWRSDYWLPRAVYEYDPTEPDYAPYATVLRDYALVDAVTTYHLWVKLERLLRERGLWKVYRARLESVPAVYRMERRGMTVDRTVLRAAQEKYGAEVADAADLLVGIAASYGYDLQLPKGATNHNLDDFIFGRGGRSPDGKRDAKLPRTHGPDTLNLPVVQTTESGAPSFGGDARDIWLGETLAKGTKPYLFVETLGRRGELTTGLSYLDGYERFLLPTDHSDRWVIHPSFRVCGTQTTRLSSNNPNAQNISKQSATNLRNCFVPRPGYELYSFDAANIELRIPAYLAGERELIDVFENPDAAPYYGSYHLFVFDILHPALFAKHGKDVKTLFEDSWYQWVKNGNFARQYGAQERKVDATYRVPGAYRLIARRFPKIDALNRAVIAGANRDGCVFTVPDREVDPDHGYQVVCRRNARDTISPTVPFAYFVSGTAGWWMNRAMAKVDRLVEAWRADEGYDGHLIATVHDEIVAELPLLQVVERVISGGQTGADQAGLRAGKRCHRTTGGWVGNGYKTLAGPDPSLRDYGLVETGTDDYPTRTRWNVRDSDATIRFASDFNTPGELCTLRAIKKYDKPHLNVSLLNQRPHEEVAAWLREHNVRTLNVAGNSESRCTGIGEYTERFLSAVLELDNGNLPRVRAIRETMESCGTALGIPTPVKAERHRETWAVGEEVA